jgi:MFS family permease
MKFFSWTIVLADRFGRKKVIIFAVFLYVLSTYILTFSHQYFWFLVESALYGMGITAMSGADTALIRDLIKRIKQTLPFL